MPCAPRGLTFAQTSKIDAKKMLQKINGSVIDQWMKDIFCVNKKRMLSVKVIFKEGGGYEIPNIPLCVVENKNGDWDWFYNVVYAILSDKWHVTTGVSVKHDATQGKFIMEPDYEGNDKAGSRSLKMKLTPEMWVPSTLYQFADPKKNVVLGLTIPMEGMVTYTKKPKLLAEMVNPSYGLPYNISPLNGTRGSRGLVAVADRLKDKTSSNPPPALTDDRIINDFFHELGVHAARISSNKNAKHGNPEVDKLEDDIDKYFFNKMNP